MLYTTSEMADQVEKCNVNNILFLKNAVRVKKEECQHEDFEDDKVGSAESANVIDNAELQDPLICDKMKQSEVFTMDNIKSERSLSQVQYDMICDSLKIEEEIRVDEAKIEFSRLLYCEDCQTYCEDYCARCKMLVHVLNKTVPINADDRSRGELPQNNILEIQSYFGQFRIFALKVIPVGVRFGPFTGLNTTKRPWKIKGGKFVVNKDALNDLNWMQYINPARNITEQNLLVFQYEHDLYYESTRQIEAGNELLVHFGEEYQDSLTGNIEMDFIPAAEHILKDAFACTFCCLGFSSKSYLAKHKTICPGNAAGGFSIEELTQCPSCKIYLDQKEYILHHMAHCCVKNDRKCTLPAPGSGTAQVTECKTRPHPLYKCQQCKYRTKYKGDLKNHTNQHYAVKTFKCGICCRRFKTNEILRLHKENTDICTERKINLKHSACAFTKVYIKEENSCSQDEMKAFKCSLCEFRTKYKVSLKRHMNVKHLGEFKYKCDTCDYRTNFQTYLKAHIEAIHLNVFKYKCDTCDYKTNFQTYLKTHIETRHLREFKYKCGTCDYGTNFKFSLDRHISTRHLKEFKYKCDTCDYKANLKAHLITHIETRHFKKFKYKCDTCDYQTSEKCHLEIHIGTKHLKEFKYTCDACDYKTNRKSNLKDHIKVKHLKDFNHKCDMCDYKTNWKSELKRHIDTKHLKEFKYKCDTCDFKTNFQTNLKTHIDTRHLKEFKFKCDLCDYKANRKSDLDTHIYTIHLKEFKYKCDMCDYKTSRTSYLKTHIQTRHLKEFKYKCDTCDYKTNFNSSLKRHVKTKHLK